MALKDNLRIVVGTDRRPAENEFFFKESPNSIGNPIGELLNFLDRYSNFEVERIPSYMIKKQYESGDYGYNGYGIRLVKKSESKQDDS